MDLYTLFAAIRDAVAQDSELSAWAADQFGKIHTVFGGFAGERLPSMDDDAPFVVLGDPADSRGMESRTIEYEISGWVGLTSGDYREDCLDNVVEPDGIEQIADALTLVRNAIAGACTGNLALVGFDTAADTMGSGSEVHGHFAARITEKLVIGQNPLT